ncbi:MAG: LPXTG cell wall anchor domain-containing protein [Deltaproteobacteria bacterium]|nr:LPXTG cell wall anchor domain-containing protein [Deltaproteobacteria bacterium]
MARTPTSPLLLLAVLLHAAPLAGQEKDFDSCMSDCEKQHFRKVLDSDGSCPKVLASIRRDLGLVDEQLGHPRLCTGKFREACMEWAAASHEALEKLGGLLADVTDCRRVNVTELGKLLWPLTPARACKGDGEYTDLHDYMTGNAEMVANITGSGATYPFSILPIPMDDDLWGQAPYCDPPLQPHNRYVAPLVEFHRTLASLEPFQACALACREPTPEQRRLFKTRDGLDAVGKDLEELHATRAQQIQVRADAFDARGMRLHPCRAFAAVDAEIAALDSDLAAAREILAALLSAEAPGGPDILALERQAESLTVRVSRLDVEPLVEECDAEDQLAVQLEERRRSLIDQLQRTGEIGLEAYEAFGRLGGDGASCRYTVECRLPLQCVKGRCGSPVSMQQVLALMDGSRGLADEALRFEIHDEDGLAPGAGETLDGLEERFKGIRQQLLDLGWEEALSRWRDAFQKSVDEQVRTLEGDAEEALARHTELPRDELRDPMACRRSVRDLEGLVGDLQAARKVLGNEDPVTNPRWVSVQLAKIQKAADALDAALAACESDCVAAEPEAGVMTTVLVAAGAGVLVLGLLAVLFLRRRKASAR